MDVDSGRAALVEILGDLYCEDVAELVDYMVSPPRPCWSSEALLVMRSLCPRSLSCQPVGVSKGAGTSKLFHTH